MDATDWSACDSGRSFAAIDFETATSERSSACAVGVVVFEQGSPVDRRRLLIRPPGNRYDPFNTVLHGIGPADTRDSPPFPEVWDQVAGMLDGHLVVAHNTAFDMSVLRRSAEHYRYEPESFPFACTYRLARSAMPEARSWGLKVLAPEFGIPLSHHDPLSDAQAAGHLWLALPERFNTTHPELLALHGYRLGRCDLSAYRSYSNAQPSSRGASSSFSAKDFTPRAEPDPDGLLYTTKIAFTGTLECMPLGILDVEHLDAYQKIPYGTTAWKTSSSRRNQIENVNSQIKDKGGLKAGWTRAFGVTAHIVAATALAAVYNLALTPASRHDDAATTAGLDQPLEPPAAPTY